MIREAVDDFCRFMRDREVNKQKYKKLTRLGVVDVDSAKTKVGDLIIVEKVLTSQLLLLHYFLIYYVNVLCYYIQLFISDHVLWKF